MRRWVSGSVLLCGLACQTYDFQRVEPIAVAQTRTGGVIIAKTLAPNLMLLVDRSGSMKDAARDGGAPKMTELRNALDGFLAQNGKNARMGLAVFPSDATCGATRSVLEPLPQAFATDEDAALVASDATAQRIRTALATVTPEGGTPTGGSLSFVGGLPGLSDDDRRADFVVLLTDGLPNCNASNPNTCAIPAACRCTLGPSCGAPGTTSCIIGCLDDQGAVSAIEELGRKQIGVFVVGFGSDTTGAAQQTLDAMAVAGGHPRDCGDAGVGCTRYYQSSSSDELGAALDDIRRHIDKDPCVYSLDTNTTVDPKFLSVDVDGGSVLSGPDTWRFDAAANAVVFQGALCDRIHASTPGHEVVVEIRALEWL